MSDEKSGEMEALPTVAEVYGGCKVLLSGFSGFIGKLIAEKLLWECPDVDTLYVMIRSKKGIDKLERLKQILESPVFDRLKNRNIDILKKIVPVEAEMSELVLGLSESDTKLILQCHFVIHCAATVRFDQPLKEAMNINTRATHELTELAKQMANIKSFVYVSTAYTNCDKPDIEIEERVYPPPADWKTMVRVANEVDMRDLQILSMKLLDVFPNTYVFSKNLAEQVINDVKTELPVAICRPSVVICSVMEPIPHFVETYFGPIGISVAFLTGALRYRLINDVTEINYIFTDVVVRNILLAGWKRAIDPPQTADDEVEVYNACTDSDGTITMDDYHFLVLRAAKRSMGKLVHVIDSGFKSIYLYLFHMLFGYALSGYVIDAFISLTGSKFRMVPFRIRLWYTTRILSYFALNQFLFINKKFTKLPDLLSDAKERASFDCTTRFNWLRESYGCTSYFYKHKLSTIYENQKKYRRRFRIMWMIDLFVIGIVYAIILYILYYFVFQKHILNDIFDMVINLLTL